jgi:hypothetical protein
MCYAYTLPHTLQLIGLCGVHRWGSSSYILAMLMLLSQTMDLEELINQIKICMFMDIFVVLYGG